MNVMNGVARIAGVAHFVGKAGAWVAAVLASAILLFSHGADMVAIGILTIGCGIFWLIMCHAVSWILNGFCERPVRYSADIRTITH